MGWSRLRWSGTRSKTASEDVLSQSYTWSFLNRERQNTLRAEFPNAALGALNRGDSPLGSATAPALHRSLSLALRGAVLRLWRRLAGARRSLRSAAYAAPECRTAVPRRPAAYIMGHLVSLTQTYSDAQLEVVKRLTSTLDEVRLRGSGLINDAGTWEEYKKDWSSLICGRLFDGKDFKPN